MRVNGTFLSAVIAFLALTGCSLAPTKGLPVHLEERTQEFSVKLETSSRFVLLEPLAPGKSCEAKRKDIFFELRGKGHRGAVDAPRSCTLVPKHVALRSKNAYGKGEYLIHAVGSGGKLPTLTADPEDPDALSGPDQDFAGAVELAENATVKGVVNFAAANATNWVQIGGARSDVSLMFLPEPGSDVDAKLYLLPPGATSPRQIGTLPPKSKRIAATDGGTLYVRIAARRFSGEANYSLLRRDVAKVKSTSLAVIDFYPVDGRSTVLLLPAHEGLKAETTLRVTGMRAGKAVSFGRCTVTSLSPTQTSCRLEAVPTADVSKLRAEYVQQGGAT